MPHDPEMRKALLKLMEENLVAFPPGYTKEEDPYVEGNSIEKTLDLILDTLFPANKYRVSIHGNRKCYPQFYDAKKGKWRNFEENGLISFDTEAEAWVFINFQHGTN